MTKKIFNEYRINKKGAECFRTRDREEAAKRLAALQAKNQTASTLCSRETAVSTGAGLWKQILPGSLAGQYGGNKWT